MHTIADLKGVATQSDDVRETMSSLAKYAESTILSSIALVLMWVISREYSFLSAGKVQEITNLNTQYLNGEESNRLIV